MNPYNKPSPQDCRAHYGVKGMKWGVRRYQNYDGSLIPAGKKRISKQYELETKKTMSTLKRSYNRMRLNAYNRAVDYMNDGGIARFNDAQRKKYGEKYTERDDYMQDYQKLFDAELTKRMNKSLDNFYKNNKHYRRGKALAERYKMTSWNELARNNEEKVNELRKLVETGRN